MSKQLAVLLLVCGIVMVLSGIASAVNGALGPKDPLLIVSGILTGLAGLTIAVVAGLQLRRRR